MKIRTALSLSIAALSTIALSWSSLAYSAIATQCEPSITRGVVKAQAPLPTRHGPRVKTSCRVPHVQIGLTAVEGINQAAFEFSFKLPGVIKRPTIVSLPGATGFWLSKETPIAKPKAIVSGREFAHIHPDGSLHAPFSYQRALEIDNKGWGERHPWADQRDGWEGLVMLYSATNEQELKVLLQLISESYNYVTARHVTVTIC